MRGLSSKVNQSKTRAVSICILISVVNRGLLTPLPVLVSSPSPLAIVRLPLLDCRVTLLRHHRRLRRPLHRRRLHLQLVLWYHSAHELLRYRLLLATLQL